MMRMCTVVLVCAAFAAFAACSSGGQPSADASPPHQIVCGDSVCEAAEIGNCMADCGSGGPVNAVCGNNQCETGETPQSCPADCGPKCGDGTCDMAGGETNANCPADCMAGSGSGTCPANNQDCLLCAFTGIACPAGLDMNSCLTCFLGGGGMLGCVGGAPNGTCEAGETPMNCPDCP